MKKRGVKPELRVSLVDYLNRRVNSIDEALQSEGYEYELVLYRKRKGKPAEKIITMYPRPRKVKIK